MSTPPVGAVRRRLCPATTRGARRATRVFAIRLILPAWKSHRRHASGRRECPRRSCAWPGRGALARRAENPGGARAHRVRPRRAPRRAARASRQGRQAPRGRDGRLGLATPRPLGVRPHSDARRPLFCVIDGSTRGRPWSATAARAQLRRLAAEAGVRRRFAPHQLRHAHAIEMAHEGVALNIIQRQLGHTDLGVTSIYLQGIDNAEIINAVHQRRPPMMPASAGLQLEERPARRGADGAALVEERKSRSPLSSSRRAGCAGAIPLRRRRYDELRRWDACFVAKRVVCLASVDVIAQGRKESSGCPPGRDRSRSELRLLAHRYDAKQKQTPTPDGEPRHVAPPARRPPHHTWGHLSAADQAVAYLELRPSPHPRGGAMISRGLSRWLRRRAGP